MTAAEESAPREDRPKSGTRRGRVWLAINALAVAVWLVLPARIAEGGLFAVLSPVMLAATWAMFATRRQVVEDAVRIALFGAFAFLTVHLQGAAMGGTRSGEVAVTLLTISVFVPLALAGGRFTAFLQPRMGKSLARLVGELVPLIVWIPAMLVSFATHRPQYSYEPRDAVSWPFEVIELRGTEDIRLAGLWFPQDGAQGAVLLVHGLGAEKVQFLPGLKHLHDTGKFAVMTFDQKNHGVSGGTTCTLGATEAADLRLVWEQFLERAKDIPGPRILVGVSMGAAAAISVAPDLRDLDGLALDSPYARLTDVAANVLPGGKVIAAVARPWGWVIARNDLLGFRPIDRAHDIPADLPIYIVHNEGDPMIPVGQSRELAAELERRAGGSDHLKLAVLPPTYHAGGMMTMYEANTDAQVWLLTEAQAHAKRRIAPK
jgi:dienelactone hydrolase